MAGNSDMMGTFPQSVLFDEPRCFYCFALPSTARVQVGNGDSFNHLTSWQVHNTKSSSGWRGIPVRPSPQPQFSRPAWPVHECYDR